MIPKNKVLEQIKTKERKKAMPVMMNGLFCGHSKSTGSTLQPTKSHNTIPTESRTIGLICSSDLDQFDLNTTSSKKIKKNIKTIQITKKRKEINIRDDDRYRYLVYEKKRKFIIRKIGKLSSPLKGGTASTKVNQTLPKNIRSTNKIDDIRNKHFCKKKCFLIVMSSKTEFASIKLAHNLHSKKMMLKLQTIKL